MNLEENLNEISKMIATTKELLDANPDDAMLLYMLEQDKALYTSTITSAYSKLLPNITSASELLQEVYQDNLKSAVDPFYIAQYFNIEVKKEPFLQNGIGRCDFFEDSITITYKPTNRLRDRFTVAHELGHIFLHFSKGISLHFEDYESVDSELVVANNNDYTPLLSAARFSKTSEYDMFEREADNFAGELLVPRVVLDKMLHRLPKGKSIKASLLQSFFNVSKPVIQIALKKYGLLNSGQVINDINIHNRGW